MDRQAMAGALAREAAFQALLLSWRGERFIADSLKEWREKRRPSSEDFQLAQQIANGACRMRLSLDHMARQLAETGKLSLKRKERALLHTALYQHLYMSRVPLYAIVDESVALAKRLMGERFAKFLNALLRRLEKKRPTLPEGRSPQALSIRHSFPEFYVEKLLKERGEEKTEAILEAENRSPVVMARDRSKKLALPVPTKRIESSAQLAEAAASKNLYIQNITPAALMAELAEGAPTPKKILDLCASPGGKLIAAHDLFPEAALFANDLSQQKLKRLSENLEKYGIKASITAGPGEEYPNKEPFSLIIIDAPCSNSGVFNKRPEARWRLDDRSLNALQQTQKKLLEHALSLLAPKGEIWYITCSILEEENEEMIRTLPLQLRKKQLHLPDNAGGDGGFGAALAQK